MRHVHLVDVYNKAQEHYKKKNFRRARKHFRKVVTEIYDSDTDSMGDINLCNSSKAYLKEINKKNLNSNLLLWILIGVVTAAVIFLFIK